MRFFFLLAVVILSFVFNALGSAQDKATDSNNTIIESYVSENRSMLCGATDIFNLSANKENAQRTIQRLYPTFQKYLNIGILSNENVELKKKNQLSYYFFYAECHISRLEGVDLIHPFDYFW